MLSKNYNSGILSLHFGPKSNALGLALYSLEGDQIFEEDDPVFHGAYFKNLEKKIPRALFFDHSNDFEMLKYVNSTSFNSANDKADSSLWNPKKVKVFNQMQKEEQEENKCSNSLLKNLGFKTNQFFTMPNLYTSKFVEYFQGNECIQDAQHMDSVKENLTKSLEEIDYLEGLQVFSDCDSGFGVYSKFVIDYLKEECSKAPVLVFPIFNRNQEDPIQKKIQILNELFTYSNFKEIELLLPLDFQKAFYNSSFIFQANETHYDIFEKALNLAPFISNSTLPIRLKENFSLKEYLNNIVFLPSLNVFNLTATIPICDGKKITESSIFDFQEEKGTFFYLNNFSNPNIWKINKDFPYFSQGFMLRGLAQETELQQPNSYKYNIKGIDSLLSCPEKSRAPKVIPEISAKYGVKEELAALPLHSCLFTNERFQEEFKVLLKEYNGIEGKIKKEFIQDEDFANDAFRELIDSIKIMCDNYDKKN